MTFFMTLVYYSNIHVLSNSPPICGNRSPKGYWGGKIPDVALLVPGPKQTNKRTLFVGFDATHAYDLFRLRVGRGIANRAVEAKGLVGPAKGEPLEIRSLISDLGVTDRAG